MRWFVCTLTVVIAAVATASAGAQPFRAGVTRIVATCRDPPGVDRAAIHQQLTREIAEFLRCNL